MKTEQTRQPHPIVIHEKRETVASPRSGNDASEKTIIVAKFPSYSTLEING